MIHVFGQKKSSWKLKHIGKALETAVTLTLKECNELSQIVMKEVPTRKVSSTVSDSKQESANFRPLWR